MVPVLRSLGKLYGLGMDVRNALYDRGIFKSHSLGAKTISVGNITTGGTGKTPLVAHVASVLAEAGEKVCILTRGYGRDNERDRILVSNGTSVLVDARTGGDEPVELATKLLGKAVVVADSDRVAAAAWAKKRFGITAFLLDDGFQHRRAKRDLDIVCIDATDPCGGGRVLPAGRLREGFQNLARADAFVITRADLVGGVDDIAGRLRKRDRRAPIFTSRMVISNVVGIGDLGSTAPPADPWTHLRAAAAADDDEVRVLAFCGLANPDAFFAQLNAAFDDTSMNGRFDLTVIVPFRDHHRYSQADIGSLEQRARENGIDALITTPKDAVKLRNMKFDIPCFVLESELAIDVPDRFRDLLLSV